MATLPTEVVYTSLAEFQANTRYTAQKTIIEANWEPSALHAQYIIDSYIGYISPYADGQATKFPTTDEDGASDVPVDIKKAHIEITSWLIAKGEPSVNDRIANSESWSGTGHSVSYGTLEESVNMGLPAFVLRLLRPYTSDTGALTY